MTSKDNRSDNWTQISPKKSHSPPRHTPLSPKLWMPCMMIILILSYPEPPKRIGRLKKDPSTSKIVSTSLRRPKRDWYSLFMNLLPEDMEGSSKPFTYFKKTTGGLECLCFYESSSQVVPPARLQRLAPIPWSLDYPLLLLNPPLLFLWSLLISSLDSHFPMALTQSWSWYRRG